MHYLFFPSPAKFILAHCPPPKKNLAGVTVYSILHNQIILCRIAWNALPLYYNTVYSWGCLERPGLVLQSWIMISSDPYNPGLKPAVLVCVCILPRPFISKRQKRKVVLVLIHKAGFLKKYFQVFDKQSW